MYKTWSRYKIRSISVEELLDTRVGSVTICVRLKLMRTHQTVIYNTKGVTLLFTEKSTLKSPIKLQDLVVNKLHKVESKLSRGRTPELCGL